MYTEKEQSLLNELTAICNANNIEVKVNVDQPKLFEGKTVSLDVEHDESGEFVGCGLLISGTNTVYYFSNLISLSHLPFRTLAIIAHNGKSDFDLLRQWGIPIIDEQLIWDTMLMAHIIDSSRRQYGLKKLAKEDLGISYPSYDDIVGKRSSRTRRTLDQWPISIVSAYNALDCFVTDRLRQKQLKQCPTTRELHIFNDIEKPCSYVFSDMETRGVRLDLPYLRSLRIELEAKKQPIEAAIKADLGNINLNSPKQLLEALNGIGLFPSLKGKPSTDKRALASLSGTVVSNLLAYSELDTLLSSFVYPYLERNTEVVHPQFNQCGTRTGRPSCSNPNLLQIPRRTDNGKLVRRMFIPRDGMRMGDCDFGQIEPRVLAHLSKDPVLCKMFNDGVDFHTFTAERLSISRDRAKVLNLSVGYRATFKSVQAQLGGTREEAQQQIDSWWGLFPTLRRWQESLIFDSKRRGFCTTLLGRRIRVDGLSDGDSWKREAAARKLINNITQGSASEIMKMAMIRIQQLDCFHPAFGLLVQVYDELLFESPRAEVDLLNVKWAMENAVELDVPLTVDCHTGVSWADTH